MSTSNKPASVSFLTSSEEADGIYLTGVAVTDIPEIVPWSKFRRYSLINMDPKSAAKWAKRLHSFSRELEALAEA